MKIGKKYIISIDAGERTLTYTATILDIEDFFVKIKDRDNKIMFIGKDHIIYFTEVGE